MLTLTKAVNYVSMCVVYAYVSLICNYKLNAVMTNLRSDRLIVARNFFYFLILLVPMFCINYTKYLKYCALYLSLTSFVCFSVKQKLGLRFTIKMLIISAIINFILHSIAIKANLYRIYSIGLIFFSMLSVVVAMSVVLFFHKNASNQGFRTWLGEFGYSLYNIFYPLLAVALLDKIFMAQFFLYVKGKSLNWVFTHIIVRGLFYNTMFCAVMTIIFFLFTILSRKYFLNKKTA